MARKSKYDYLLEVAEYLTEMARYEGRTDKYVVIRDPKDRRQFIIVCLKEVER